MAKRSWWKRQRAESELRHAPKRPLRGPKARSLRIESLEQREMLAVLPAQFDFGTSTSPVQEDWIQVTPATSYSAQLGYGWSSGSISGGDWGLGNAMTRDLNSTSDGTFVVDVPDPGLYQVTLTVGIICSPSVPCPGMEVYLEGQLVETVSTTEGVVTKTYLAVVNDGQLTLRLHGTQPWPYNGVLIPGFQVEKLPQMRFDFGTTTSPVETGWMQVTPGTTYSSQRGYGWSSGSVTAGDWGLGNTMTRDLNATSDGTFVVDVPDPGLYQVTLTLGIIAAEPIPCPGMEVYLEGQLVETVSTTEGVVTKTYLAVVNDGQLALRLHGTQPWPYSAVLIPGLQVEQLPQMRFDFGTTTSPVEAGWMQVTPGTTYSSQRGYGWSSGTISSGDWGLGNDMTRDLNATSDGTFVVDVPDPGLYQVTLTLGIIAGQPIPCPGMEVYLEGQLVETVSTTQGVVTKSYLAVVNDGQLTVRLRGTQPWPYNGVLIPGLQVEKLPRMRFDFGTTTSPVEAGWMQVTPGTTYSSQRGYGWSLGTISSGDWGLGNAMTRDLNATSDGTFVVDVPDPGLYQVTLTLGIIAAEPIPCTGMEVYLEGQLVETVSTTEGVVTKTYLAVVNDGQLALRLHGTQPWPYDGVLIPGLQVEQLPQMRFDFGTTTSPVETDWMQVTPGTTYTSQRGYGWSLGSITAGDWGLGNAMTRDLNATSDGTFVVDLPDPGVYQVALTLGIIAGQPIPCPGMEVYLEGQLVETVSTTEGVVTKIYLATVDDGQLTLRLRGTQPWPYNGVLIPGLLLCVPTDSPGLDAIPNPSPIAEDPGQQVVNLSGITAAGGRSCPIQVTALSSNTAIVPHPTVDYTWPGTTGSLAYTPVANASGTATITVTVRDAGLDLILGNADDAIFQRQFTVVVNPVNDAPTLDTISNRSISEDAGLQTVNLTGITAGGGESQTLQVTATSSNTALIPNPTVNYTSPNSTGSLSFTPVADQSGTSVITVTVRDTGLDLVLGNGDDGTTQRTFTVTVNAVNDPPTLNTIPNPAAINDDSGQQVVSLSGISAGGGESQSLQVTAVSSNTALIPSPAVTYVSPNSTGSLSYTPMANASGTSVITVTVRDAGLDLVLGNGDDGTTQRTFTVSVNAVNDAPSGTTATKTILEDATYPLTAADFGLTDPLDDPPNVLHAVKISSLHGAGSLKFDGVSVTAGQFVLATDIDAGKLTFAPAADANGTSYASFAFQVQDDGGTANGGVDLDPTENSLTFNVTAVNDPPAGANATRNILEDGQYTFVRADFDFDDPFDAPKGTLDAVKITTLPYAGNLRLNGQLVIAEQYVSVTDIDGGKFIFVPAANGNGSPYTSFAFQVRDDGGTADGGVNLDQNPNTFTFDVRYVPPSPSVNSISDLRIEGRVITATGNVTDPVGAYDTLVCAWAVYKDGVPGIYDTGGNVAEFNFTPLERGVYRIVLSAWHEGRGVVTSAERTIIVTGADTLYWDPDQTNDTHFGGGGNWDDANAWVDSQGNRCTWQSSLDGIPVVFAGDAGTVTVNPTLEVGSITFQTTGYTLSGGAITLTGEGGYITVDGGADSINSVLAGSVGLRKLGAGTLTLGGANSYAGSTSIDSGTLEVINGGSLGTGSVTNNGAFVVNRSDTLTLSNAIAGSGGLTKTGDGTLVLVGSSTYAGDTAINQGELRVLGSIASEATLAGGVLSGTGTAGPVTATAGALSPGNGGVGTLATGNLALNAGSQFQVDLSDTGCDLLNVTGTVSLGNATLQLTSTCTDVYGLFVLLQNNGTDATTGTFFDLAEGAAVNVQSMTYHITYCYNAETGELGSGNDVALIESQYATPPTGLQATLVSANELYLEWRDNATIESGYSIEQWTGATWQVVQTVAPNAGCALLSGPFAPSRLYSFRVRANGVSSRSSNVASATTPAWPAAPTDFYLWSSGLVWQDVATDETGYVIERSLDGIHWSALTTDPLPANQTSYQLTERIPEVPNYCRVQAINAIGGSGYATYMIPTQPAAPSDLQVTVVSGSQMNLSWHDNSCIEDGFNVKLWRNDVYQGWFRIGDTNVTSQTLAGLFEPSTQYRFAVSAEYLNSSPLSNVVTITTPAWPAAPIDLVATVVSSTEVELGWSYWWGAESFRIEMLPPNADPGDWTYLGTVDVWEPTTFSVTGLTAGDAGYLFRVAAVNQSGSSGYATCRIPRNPDISEIEDAFTVEGCWGLQCFSISDDQTPPDSLILQASSSNQELVPDANIHFGGSGSERFIAAEPIDERFGTTVITVSVSDGVNIATESFLLTVVSKNDPPSFTPGSDQTISEDAAPQTVVGWASAMFAGPNEFDQELHFVVTTTNDSLFSALPAIDPLTGTLTYTPAPNAHGSAFVTARLQDDGGLSGWGTDTSAPQTFKITVQPSGDAPTISQVETLLGGIEDSDFTITYEMLLAAADEADLDGDVVTFRVETVTSGTLTKNHQNVTEYTTLLGSGESLVWHPAANANGTLPAFTVVAFDGEFVSTTTVPVTVRVMRVNDAPTLSSVTTMTGGVTDADFTITYQMLALAADEADVDGDALSFRIETLCSGTLTKNGQPVTEQQTLLSTGDSLVWHPVPAQFGVLTAMTVVAWDGQASSGTAVPVTVGVVVNNRPTLTAISPLVDAIEDTDFAISYAMLAAAADEADIDGNPLSFLVETVSSGTLTTNGQPIGEHTTLLSIGESLAWHPAPNAHGTLPAFTVVASDGWTLSTPPVQVSIQVAAVNDAPTLTAVQTLPHGQPDTNFTITYQMLASAANEADVDGDTLSFQIETVSSGTLTKNGQPVTEHVTLLSAGESLIWHPVAGQFGVQTAMTVVAWDGQASSAAPVPVNVAVNTPPTLTVVSSLMGAVEDTDFAISYEMLAAAADEADVDGDPLSFLVETMISGTLTKNGQPAIEQTTLLSAGDSLVWHPGPNANGILQAFTVAAFDGHLASTAPAVVNVQVAPTNDAPLFLKGANQEVLEDSGPQTVPGWASSIFAGPADEASQVLQFTVTTNNDALFLSLPSIDPATGTLSYTPAMNANGSATVTVSLHDDGGTANGGIDTSAPETFTIAVAAINDSPSDIALDSSSIGEHLAAGTLVGRFSTFDPDTPETFSYALVEGAGSQDNSSFTIVGSELRTAEVFDYDAQSSYSIRVRSTDAGGLSVEEAFTITVEQALADLQITGFSAQSSYEPNGTADWRVDYVVDSATMTAFRIGFYRSADNVNADVLLQEYVVTAPADLVAGTHSVLVRPDFVDVDSDYYLLARLDSAGVIPEVDETNNQMRFGGGFFQSTDGTIHYQGTDGADVIVLSDSETAPLSITSDGVPSGSLSGYSRIRARLHAGNDRFSISTPWTPVAAWGGAGDDQIVTGGGNDVLIGGDGADFLCAGLGADILEGDGTVDFLDGDLGFDEPEILDNGQAGYTESAAGWTTGVVGAGFNGSQRVPAPSAGENTAIWRFADLPAGYYDVYVTWDRTGQATPAVNASFAVLDGTTTRATITVDQTVDPQAAVVAGVPWQLLGVFQVTSGKLEVQLSDQANGVVMADAVRIVRNTFGPALANPIDDIQLDAGETQIDLSQLFTVAPGAVLTYTVVNDNPSLMTATVVGSELVLIRTGTGNAYVTIQATDQLGRKSTAGFRASYAPTLQTGNDAPNVKRPIPDYYESAFTMQDPSIALADHFGDADGDSLTYSVSVSPTPDGQSLLSTQLANGVLTLHVNRGAFGEATLTVTASDGSHSVQDSFTVYVAPANAIARTVYVEDGQEMLLTLDDGDFESRAGTRTYFLPSNPGPLNTAVLGGMVVTWTPAPGSGPQIRYLRVGCQDLESGFQSFATYRIVVLHRNLGPELGELPDEITVNEGEAVSFSVGASSPDFPSSQLHFSAGIEGSPAGLTAPTIENGQFHWTAPLLGPGETGTYIAVVYVEDDSGMSTWDTVTIFVEESEGSGDPQDAEGLSVPGLAESQENGGFFLPVVANSQEPEPTTTITIYSPINQEDYDSWEVTLPNSVGAVGDTSGYIWPGAIEIYGMTPSAPEDEPIVLTVRDLEGVTIYTESIPVTVVSMTFTVGDGSQPLRINDNYDEGNYLPCPDGTRLPIRDNGRFDWVWGFDAYAVAPVAARAVWDDDDLLSASLTVQGPTRGAYWFETDGNAVVWRRDGQTMTRMPTRAEDAIHLSSPPTGLLVEAIGPTGDITAHFLPDGIRFGQWELESIASTATPLLGESAPPVVSVTAIDKYATESGLEDIDYAAVTFSRGLETNADLYVDFTVSGSATYSADYYLSAYAAGDTTVSPVGGHFQVKIPAGLPSTTVLIRAPEDVVPEWDEQVVVSILPSANPEIWPYRTDPNRDTAEVTILEANAPAVDRNTDAVSTGQSPAEIGMGPLVAGVQEGDVRLAIPLGTSSFSPVYVGSEGAYPIVVEDVAFPIGASLANLSAEFRLANLPAQSNSYTLGSSDGTPLRFAFQADARSLPTGQYPYEIIFTASSMTRRVRGTVQVVNRLSGAGGGNPYGDGLWIPGLTQLIPYNGTPANGEGAYQAAAMGAGVAQSGMLLVRDGNSTAAFDATNFAVAAHADSNPGLSVYAESGSWQGALDGLADHRDYRFTTSSQATATWSLSNLTPGGIYEVFASWVPGSDRTSQACYQINGATPVGSAGNTTVYVDQRYLAGPINGSEPPRRSLGFFRATGGTITVTLTGSETGKTVADGVIAVNSWRFETPRGTLDQFEDPNERFGQLQANRQDLTFRSKFGDRDIFGTDGRLNDIYDPSDNRTHFAYTGPGSLQLQSVTDAYGLSTTYEYAGNTLSRVTDFAGRRTTFDWAESLTVTLPDPGQSQPGGIEWTLGYNGDRLLDLIADPEGHTTAISYAAHRFAGAAHAQGLPEQVSWSLQPVLVGLLPHGPSAGQSPEQSKAIYTDPNQHDWTYQTDRFGYLTSEEKPGLPGVKWQWIRNIDGQVTDYIEPAGGGGWGETLGALTTHYEYDSAGNLTRLAPPIGSVEQYEYDLDFSQLSDAIVGGVHTDYLLDSRGRVRQLRRYAVGEEIYSLTNYGYTPTPVGADALPAGLIVSVVEAAGTYDEATTTTEYYTDAARRGLTKAVTSAADTPEQGTVKYDYDSRRNVSFVLDELNRPTEYVYDDLDRLVEVREADPGTGDHGATVTRYGYDRVGNQTLAIDARQSRTETRYDGLNRPTLVILPATVQHGPAVTSYTYDDNGNVLTVTDPLLATTVNVYNERNELTSVTSPPNEQGLSSIAVYEYDKLGNLKAVYDSFGRPHDGNPGSPLVTYQYDARHLLTTTTEAGTAQHAAAVTFILRDTAGRPQVVKTASATTTADTFSQTSDDPSDTTANTTYHYDSLGRVDTVTLPRDLNGVRAYLAYEYDRRDNLTKVTDANGTATAQNLTDGVTEYKYDDRNRAYEVWQYDDGRQLITQYSYDEAGQLRAVTDPLQRTTHYDYDNLGRVIKTTEPDPDNTGPQQSPFSVNHYDELGNLVAEADAYGHGTLTEYDSLGRVIKVTDANQNSTRYTYDKAGNLRFLTDASGNLTEWKYDQLGQVVEEKDPSGHTQSYIYDQEGRLYRHTDRNERTTEYAYDALGQLTSETWIDAGRTITYTYDKSGDLAGVADPDAASYGYLYDPRGRLTEQAVGIGGLSPVVTLVNAYDNEQNRTDLTLRLAGVDTFTNHYDYDDLNRLKDAWQSGSQVTGKWVHFTWDDGGRLGTVTRRFQVSQLVATSTYTFDDASRLTGLVHAQVGDPLAEYTWVFDQANRLTGESYETSTFGVDSRGASYEYDDRGQLTRADYDLGLDDETYHYDATGNRNQEDDGYVTTSANRMASDGTYAYTYDGEGNRTARFVDNDHNGVLSAGDTDVTTYAWDYRNRLTTVTDHPLQGGPAAQIVSYSYDAFNRLVGRDLDSNGDGNVDARRRYVYDGDKIVAQFDGVNAPLQSSNLTHAYLWAETVDQLLADDNLQTGKTLWPLADQLGTARDLAEYDTEHDTTTIAKHRDFSAFGELANDTNEAVDYLFGFTGQPFDSATGLQNNLNRWYDPSTGRWLSEDPIGFAGGDENLYRYVGNRATMATDASGLAELALRFAPGHPAAPAPVSSEFANGAIALAKSYARSSFLANWDRNLEMYRQDVIREALVRSAVQGRIAQGDFWDAAQVGLDAWGVAEPTPFCDLASGVISLFRGRWSDAGYSFLAMVPYIGDIGKLGKYGAKLRKAEKLAAEGAELAADAAKAESKVLKAPAIARLPTRGTPERAAIEAARMRGIRAAKAGELANIRAGGKGSGVWTEAELQQIRQTGKFPSDVRWHHDPTVANRPDLAADPSVIRPVRRGVRGHLDAHGGDFRQ